MKASESLEAATKLVRQYAHIKADEVFISAIAAVLSQYPPGLVNECTDPRTGVAKTSEFLSIKVLTEWCDARLVHHQTMSQYVALPAPKSEPVFSDEHRQTMLQRLQKLMHGIVDGKRENWTRPVGAFEHPDDKWNDRRRAQQQAHAADA